MSRIFYEGKYYDYPLKALNALGNLGPKEAVLCGLSYLWARMRPPKDQTNYENWLVARFGWRLYRTFFETYTQKVWGVPVRDMPADWAAQRVKNLNLSKAVLNAVLPKRNQKDITSLIEEFQYPKFGPGMMWERCRELVEKAGGTVRMETSVRTIHVVDGEATSVTLVLPDGSDRGMPCLPCHLHHAHVVAGHEPRPAAPARGADGGTQPALPRLPHCGPGGPRVEWLSGQLDLHPLARGQGRADPELRLLVALHGQRRPDVPWPRVLRLRGRRAVDQLRREL